METPRHSSYRRRIIFGLLAGVALAAVVLDYLALRTDIDRFTLIASVVCLAVAGAFVAGGGLSLIAAGVRFLAAWVRRRKRLLIALSAGLAAAGAIVVGVLQFRFGVDTPVRFQKTTQPQIAVFATQRYTVGLGAAPVLDEHQHLMVLDGRTIVLYEDALQQICRDHGLPNRCWSGERILIKAQIHLEPRRIRGSPFPGPDREVYYPEHHCYVVVIDKLIDFAWEDGCD